MRGLPYRRVKRDPGNGHARAGRVLVYLDPEGAVRLRDGSTAVLAEGVLLEVTGMRPLCEICWIETAVVFAFDLGSGTSLVRSAAPAGRPGLLSSACRSPSLGWTLVA
jgi:hypothetical protein